MILFGNGFPSGVFKDPKRFGFDCHDLRGCRIRI
jgi:hypothetical protein